jgi:N-acetylated-alpha-linked acidic dipeptidase
LPQSRVLWMFGSFVCAAVLLAAQASSPSLHVPGFKDFAEQQKLDQSFMVVPDAKLAGQELKILTAAPHVAASKEDYLTAVYVAQKFKGAGLQTQIVPYQAWLNLPVEVKVEAFGPDGKLLMSGPAREHVEGDPYQDDPRVTPAFNGSSPSGDVTAEVVYANYGRPEDFQKLADMGISVKGKIVMVRYGANFRGVKAYLAQQHGAAGVIIYSDPADDGYFRGDMYPKGAYRPATAVQRGSIEYLFKYPGDVLTPGIASRPGLPAAQRTSPENAAALPKIPSTPLSYHDAAPILEALGGPNVPHEWQGALPFAYHVGGEGVKVHLLLKMDYQYRTLWDVIGKIPGTEYPEDWVVAGNHRDAWVYGAADPNSGTAAMLEAVHGLGRLLQQGWKPKRTIYFCSWDGEEEGLIGSTEWSEDHAAQLAHAVAYFNTDVGVSGPNFDASAVPSLKGFIREITREVASPKGGTVYEQWKASQADAESRRRSTNNGFNQHPITGTAKDVEIGDLGSGSDYTPFLQHLGVPSTDIGSNGPYGVYHSTFDDYAWFVKNADPTFVYEQEMARVFGLEVLHMADADVLPYDYVTYGEEIEGYLRGAQKKAQDAGITGLDFTAALAAAHQFTAAAEQLHARQESASGNLAELNGQLREVEEDLLNPQGLPGRPWYKHTIYAPGEYTGYAAVVIPGVNEALDAKDVARAQAQLADLVQAIERGTATLEGAGRTGGRD